MMSSLLREVCSPESVHRSHSALDLSRNVDRGGCERRRPEILLRDLDRHASGDRMARMGIAQRNPCVLAFASRSALPPSPLRIALPSQRLGAFLQEGFDLLVESRCHHALARVGLSPRGEPRRTHGCVAGRPEQGRLLVAAVLDAGGDAWGAMG